MAPQSARSLMWASLALLVVGGAVGSPEAGVAAAALAGLCAVAPVVFGTKGIRVAGILLLLASIGMASVLLPSAKRNMARYRDGAHRTQKAAAPGTTEAR